MFSVQPISTIFWSILVVLFKTIERKSVLFLKNFRKLAYKSISINVTSKPRKLNIWDLLSRLEKGFEPILRKSRLYKLGNAFRQSKVYKVLSDLPTITIFLYQTS